MKKNLLLFVLVTMVVIALPYATWHRYESHRLVRLLGDIEKECAESRSNAQMERDRQYQMARQLIAENDELKQRLKSCGK
jgi:hypothetical protein